MFALNVTETLSPVATKDFHGIISDNVELPFPDVNNSAPPEHNRARTEAALRVIRETLEKFRGEVVGIVVEPIQGAGGHRMAEPEFFHELSRLTHEHGVFLGFDEVQTEGRWSAPCSTNWRNPTWPTTPLKYIDHHGSGGNDYHRREGLDAYILPATAPDAPGQLYDLANDPGETTNLYFEHPERVKEMKALLDQSIAAGRSAPLRGE